MDSVFHLVRYHRYSMVYLFRPFNLSNLSTVDRLDIIRRLLTFAENTTKPREVGVGGVYMIFNVVSKSCWLLGV